MNNDSRNLRSGQSSLASAVDRSFGDDQPSAPAVVVKTIDDPMGNPYPSTARSVFAVVQQEIGSTEVAGSAVTLTDLSGHFYAENLGAAVPPLSTGGLIAVLHDGLYVFSYNG